MNTNFHLHSKIFDFKDIESVEIIEDNVSVSKTDRKSQLIGAGIGGAIAGGTGAILGGLSGKSTTVQEVQNITLRVAVKNYNNPIYDFPILRQKKPINKMDDIYKFSYKEAYVWHNILTKIINEEKQRQFNKSNVIETIDEEAKAHKKVTKNKSSKYIEELERIASLKERGLITEEEYELLKDKIML
ncbi:TPA: SHOCT domain-containing protein [Staphylococcus pseudintermedius]|nr:SHOCT domain-containing protein [Staphylococcus pseudintermedius]